MFADIEQFLVAVVAERRPLVRACTELPGNLTAVLPVWQIVRIGGPDRVPSLDPAVVDVDCFAADRGLAKVQAEDARQLLRYELAGYTAGHVTVADVETVQGPAWRPYANTGVRSVGATYRITLHNHS